ncbi:hypothetical protein [Segetibacter koreensis]|uniref:hypothetical protein n=1 Tax=Segetibacter koreensis TaxID=398037 RepID=UPI00037D6897|nr:hypothetical protein [Segetibacter koreensis]
MKKKLLICMLVLAFPLSELFSQVKDSIVQLAPVTVTSTAMVTKEVNKAFRKSFPDAQDLKWYRQDKDYLAKFIMNDMDHNALFKKNGYLKYDVAFGSEKNLPDAIRQQIQSAYEEFKITRAFNVKESNRDIWVVNLEGLKNYVMVRVEDGELEEVNKFKKAS